MHSSENLLDTLTRLFPHGVTTTLDMATRLSQEEIGNIALSEVRVLSAKDGPQDFVIAYIDATRVTRELEIQEGYRRDYEIAYCLRVPPDDLRFLVLSEYPDAQLEPGKISPFDLERLSVKKFSTATILIAQSVQHLADEGIDMILPYGPTGFEILPTGTVIEQIQNRLSNEWSIVLAHGAPYYDTSEHI